MPKVELGVNRATGLCGQASILHEARAAIDAETSAAILAGFDYEVDGELLHFSYDAFDQQNFADTANACLMAQGGEGNALVATGLPQTVSWNGYRADGALVQVAFDAAGFLAFYAGGALAHKARCMAQGGAKKAALGQEG